MSAFLNGIFYAIYAWFFKGTQDEYVKIQPAPVNNGEVAMEIPQRLRERDIPNFGEEQEHMLQMAMRNFPSEDLQVKWLKKIHHLRFNTRHGWIGEKGGRKTGDLRYDDLGYTVSKSKTDVKQILIMLEDADFYVPVKNSKGPSLTRIK